MNSCDERGRQCLYKLIRRWADNLRAAKLLQFCTHWGTQVFLTVLFPVVFLHFTLIPGVSCNMCLAMQLVVPVTLCTASHIPPPCYDGADHVSTFSHHHLGHMFLTLALPLPRFPDLPGSPRDWAVSRQRDEGGHECHAWRGWKFTGSLVGLHKWSQLSEDIKGKGAGRSLGMCGRECDCP